MRYRDADSCLYEVCKVLCDYMDAQPHGSVEWFAAAAAVGQAWATRANLAKMARSFGHTLLDRMHVPSGPRPDPAENIGKVRTGQQAPAPDEEGPEDLDAPATLPRPAVEGYQEGAD